MDIKIGQCYIDHHGIFKVTAIRGDTVIYDDLVDFSQTSTFEGLKGLKGSETFRRYFTDEKVKPLTRLERIIYNIGET